MSKIYPINIYETYMNRHGLSKTALMRCEPWLERGSGMQQRVPGDARVLPLPTVGPGCEGPNRRAHCRRTRPQPSEGRGLMGKPGVPEVSRRASKSRRTGKFPVPCGEAAEHRIRNAFAAVPPRGIQSLRTLNCQRNLAASVSAFRLIACGATELGSRRVANCSRLVHA
jgi:hypothetical protein